MTAAEFRAAHGDPEDWDAQDFKDYFEVAAVEDWVRRHPIRAWWSDALVALKRPLRRRNTNTTTAAGGTR